MRQVPQADAREDGALRMDEWFPPLPQRGFSGGEKKRAEMSRWPSWSRSSRSSTRPTPGLDMTPCASSPRGQPMLAPNWRAGDHPLPAPLQLHHARPSTSSSTGGRRGGWERARTGPRGGGLRPDPARGLLPRRRCRTTRLHNPARAGAGPARGGAAARAGTAMAIIDLDGVTGSQSRSDRAGQPMPPMGSRSADPHRIRRDFPILEERVHGKRLVWLDNAATTQKPCAVIERISRFYEEENSNIHRGARPGRTRHRRVRGRTRGGAPLLQAPSAREIVFTRGATEAINLAARLGPPQQEGRRDPADAARASLQHRPLADAGRGKGRAHPSRADRRSRADHPRGVQRTCSNPRTRVVFAHVSNTLGTVLPVREMTAMAHRSGARVLVDGAQAVSHVPVDVQSIGLRLVRVLRSQGLGPTGIGALWRQGAARGDSTAGRRRHDRRRPRSEDEL